MTNRDTSHIEDLPVEVEDESTVLKSIGSGAEVIARIHNLTKLIDSAVKAALTRTLPQDWVLQGEKYYLQATGIQKIRAIFGIYYKDMIPPSKITLESGGYAYVIAGTVGSSFLNKLYGDTEIWIEGMRSSTDAFFTGKDGNKTFDEMDIRKAAHANFQVRGATALLGLGNFTRSDLIKMGVNIERIQKVEYQKGAEGGGDANVISEAQRKRLFAICKSHNIVESYLKIYLQENFKIDSTSKILRKDYEQICAWAEAGGIQERSSDEFPTREPGSEG